MSDCDHCGDRPLDAGYPRKPDLTCNLKRSPYLEGLAINQHTSTVNRGTELNNGISTVVHTWSTFDLSLPHFYYENRRVAQNVKQLNRDKAQRRSLYGKPDGKNHRADHANQILNRDLRSSEGALEVQENHCSYIFTHKMSDALLVVPMVKASHFGEVMRRLLAKIITSSEKKFLDYDDGNQSEHSIQKLRDTSMTMLTSAANLKGPCYWLWALRYALAAYKHNFIPRQDGMAPHLHWQDKLPPDLSLPVFGSRIVYRQ